jgi:peptide/nickel transport system substrate-binding protein
LVLTQWSPDYLDPHSTIEFFASNPDNADNGQVRTGAWRNRWSNPALTEAVAAALRIRETPARIAAYEAIQRELQQAGPIVPLFRAVERFAHARNVENLLLGPSFDTPIYWRTTKS